jgi:hypothetical protein
MNGGRRGAVSRVALREAERLPAVVAQANASELPFDEPQHEESAEIVFRDTGVAACDFHERRPFLRRARNTAK